MAQVISSLRILYPLSYLAQRLLLGQGLRRQRFIFLLQLGAIALSSGGALLILMLSYSFRTVITERLHGYFGSLWVQYYAGEQANEPRPIQRSYLYRLNARVESAVHLPVLIEGSEGKYEGVQAIAVEKSWWENPLWRSNVSLVTTDWSEESGIILSRRLADRLGVQLGEKITLVWLAEPPRLRRLPVIGLYDARIEEIDKRVAFVPLPLGQRLLGWDSSQVQIGHVYIHSPEDQQAVAETLIQSLPSSYELVPIQNIFPDIFGWLGLIEQNVQVILGIVVGLSFFAIASGFLVLQFAQRLRYEVLWVLGTTPSQLRYIIFHQAVLSVMLGTFIGMAWASLLLWTQAEWNWFHLDPENYLLSSIPVRWHYKPYFYVIGMGLLLSAGLSWLTYPRKRSLRLLAQAE
ncbi:MAG: FtsX-like permease family protein [Bacteroidia bacterium]